MRRASQTIPFPSIECRTWGELVRQFDTVKGWIFRGHASANWLLRSTLERRTPAGESAFITERYLQQQFKRRAHTYLAGQSLPENAGDWLALMQHFGAPTRLLDFTRSPYVAAYFAFEEL